MDYNQVGELLSAIDYYNRFEKYILNRSYPNINYGKRQGIISFDSLFDASSKYTYSNKIEEEIFEKWHQILINPKSKEQDLFITCLEIFDWGNVLDGNVRAAIQLHKQQQLQPFITMIINLLNSRNIIDKTASEQEILWSSGWTKVYSFIHPDILIYDSRVSAFLNHTLVHELEINDSFKELSKHLFNFNGAIGRKRKLDKSFGFKNSHPKGVRGFNANLVSSWIIQHLIDQLNLKQSVRDFERAFFMLGFDLDQL